MTVAQLMHEFVPPELFHGRRWGSWVLDVERWCLVFEDKPYFYEVDLERIRDSAAALDWIYQILGKAWATSRAMRDLLNALDDVIDPQASLCSGAMGGGRGGR